jgi:hypothetical protein
MSALSKNKKIQMTNLFLLILIGFSFGLNSARGAEMKNISPGIVENCPSELVLNIIHADWSKEQPDIYSTVEDQEIKCHSEVISYISIQLTQNSSLPSLNKFFSHIHSYGRYYDEKTKNNLIKFYLEIAPKDYDGLEGSYFEGLIQMERDISSQLKGKVNENWEFESYQDRDSLTWSYSVYKAFWKDFSGLKKIEEKIKTFQGPAEEILMPLRSLFPLLLHKDAQVKKETKNIIDPYKSDQRRLTAVCGDPLPDSNNNKCKVEKGLALGEALNNELEMLYTYSK